MREMPSGVRQLALLEAGRAGHPDLNAVSTARRGSQAAAEADAGMIGPALSAPEHGATGNPAGGARPSGRTLPPGTLVLATDALAAQPASTTVTEIVIVEADRADADQGYLWRWEIIYGLAHRSGACRTRAQAAREAAIVLALLIAD